HDHDNNDDDKNNVLSSPTSPAFEPSLEGYGVLNLLCGISLASVLLALVYRSVRRQVYGDDHNMDLSFDAGGKVSSSLVAVSLAAHLLWPSHLVQGASNVTTYGISSGFWYSLPVITNILLFTLLSLQLKARAPGAKTFLQLIEARFGRKAHLLYSGFALLINLVIIATILVAGVTLFRAFVKDISDEMIVLVMAAVFGAHAFAGGLGAIFYVSYLNVVIVLCALSYVVTKMFYLSEDDLPFGNITQSYRTMAAPKNQSQQSLNGPDLTNLDITALLTFWSFESLLRACKGTLLFLPVVFCDQATWQSKIAAKPMQGVVGFLGASMIWFAIPATVGTSAGVAFLALSGAVQNSNISSNISSAINNSTGGFVYSINSSFHDGGNSTGLWALSAEEAGGQMMPVLADLALGKHGGIGFVVVLTMIMMSTGSREIMAVASIIVYDFYQKYILPFRTTVKTGHCVLCGRPKLGEATETIFIDAADIYCCCPSFLRCSDCTIERETITKADRKTLAYQLYTCPVHGQYRAYQDTLHRLHRWVVIWITLSIVPVGILVITSGLGITWIFTFGTIVTLPALPGIILSLAWVKVTAQGLIAGSISGLTCGLAANLARAASLDGGLWNFLANTVDDTAVLAGAAACLIVSLCVTVVVSLATHKIRTPADAEKEWQKLRDIDNPLCPWQQDMRTSQLPPSAARRPTYLELKRHSRSSRIAAIIGSTALLAIFIFIIPGCLHSLGTMTSSDLRRLMMTSHIWCFTTTALVVVLTPVEEIWGIWSALKKKRRRAKVAEDSHRCRLTETSLDTELKTRWTLK
ncbi:hypothetical protein RRG08_000368, partial [Elysia crispata]